MANFIPAGANAVETSDLRTSGDVTVTDTQPGTVNNGEFLTNSGGNLTGGTVKQFSFSSVNEGTIFSRKMNDLSGNSSVTVFSSPRDIKFGRIQYEYAAEINKIDIKIDGQTYYDNYIEVYGSETTDTHQIGFIAPIENVSSLVIENNRQYNMAISYWIVTT